MLGHVENLHRGILFGSTFNKNVITGVGMCTVVTEAAHSVALWTRTLSQVWACVSLCGFPTWRWGHLALQNPSAHNCFKKRSVHCLPTSFSSKSESWLDPVDNKAVATASTCFDNTMNDSGWKNILLEVLFFNKVSLQRKYCPIPLLQGLAKKWQVVPLPSFQKIVFATKQDWIF